MKVLVCGGRMFARVPRDLPREELEWWHKKAQQESSRLRSALYKLHAERTITLIIEGGALGADRIGRLWASRNKIPCVTYDAEWDANGKAAGMIRNRKMLEEGEPDCVVAASGGKGTANMTALARAAQIEVIEVE